jgi:Co/Zn/Cd efflux system component
MGVIGMVALGANGTCFALLWSHRNGDSNMRAVWVCSRNDVMGNFAVLLAALGVFGTSTRWPDVIVAAIMAYLALQGAWQVIRLALTELDLIPPRHSPPNGAIRVFGQYGVRPVLTSFRPQCLQLGFNWPTPRVSFGR